MDPSTSGAVESEVKELEDETHTVYKATVRTAARGLAIVDARIGFKNEAGDLSYAFKTSTDEYGRFTSGSLLPGRYLVDIQKDGYISQVNQEIEIREHIVTRGNHVLSEPLGSGAWRIVASWTPKKANAVRDVDSYLAIPGAASPLYYQLKGQDYNGAKLDRDSSGQLAIETITISNLRQGSYAYFVNNFSSRTEPEALGKSNVTIQVFSEDRHIATLSVPAGEGLTYEAFRIEDGRFRQTGVFSNAFVDAD